MGRIEVDLESPDAVVVRPLHEVERRKLQNEGDGRRSQDLRRDDDVDDRRDADRLQPVAPDDEEVPEERDEGRKEERVKADEDVDDQHGGLETDSQPGGHQEAQGAKLAEHLPDVPQLARPVRDQHAAHRHEELHVRAKPSPSRPLCSPAPDHQLQRAADLLRHRSRRRDQEGLERKELCPSLQTSALVRQLQHLRQIWQDRNSSIHKQTIGAISGAA